MSFADQLVVLRDGALVQAGRPRELYLAPADPATAAFLGPAIILDAEIRDGIAHCALGDLPVSQSQRGIRRQRADPAASRTAAHRPRSERYGYDALAPGEGRAGRAAPSQH